MPIKDLVIFEDDSALTLEPLTLTRPVWDLLCGIRTLREKVAALFPETTLHYFARTFLSSVSGSQTLEELNKLNATWINGSFLADSGLKAVIDLAPGCAWIQNGRVVAFCGSASLDWGAGTSLPANGFQCIEAPEDSGALCRYPWELVQAMNVQNDKEAHTLRQLGQIRGDVHPKAILIRSEDIYIGTGAQIGAGAVLDASKGPIVLDDDVLIGANAVMEGPTCLKCKVQVKPLSQVVGSCLGEESRVGGEVSCSIIQGFSNKQHGGFLGHSFIGSWCNLGSGTETSNLKNNYSPIKVQVGKNLVDTESLFVGLTMGDHSKSAIGSVFNTGAVVGVGCNIFGAGFPPRFVPSFHWGGAEKLTRYPFKPTLETARAMMARRNWELTQEMIEILEWVYQHRTE
ncbi:MAG: putative sugar nucleotidyl transferase [bacterium]